MPELIPNLTPADKMPTSQWRPVETAPRDGNVFLAMRRDRVVFCAWIEACTVIETTRSLSGTKSVSTVSGRFLLCHASESLAADFHYTRSDTEIRFSKWMLLPEDGEPVPVAEDCGDD